MDGDNAMEHGPFKAVVEALQCALPGLKYEVDQPSSDRGEWWLDVADADWTSTASWQSDGQFGIFTREGGYGQKPDELFDNPTTTAARLLELAAQARDKPTGALTAKGASA